MKLYEHAQFYHIIQSKLSSFGIYVFIRLLGTLGYKFDSSIQARVTDTINC